MSSRTKSSEWRRDSRSYQVEVDFTSPGLAVMEVEKLLFCGRSINSHANEVWPRLYIGDMDFAENRAELRRQNFTHVLNCAHSTRRGAEFYDGMGITYLGIEAHDSPAYDMSVNFNTGAEFIHNALRGRGEVSAQVHTLFHQHPQGGHCSHDSHQLLSDEDLEIKANAAGTIMNTAWQRFPGPGNSCSNTCPSSRHA